MQNDLDILRSWREEPMDYVRRKEETRTTLVLNALGSAVFLTILFGFFIWVIETIGSPTDITIVIGATITLGLSYAVVAVAAVMKRIAPMLD